jgi:ATP-binding cassette subfamily B protein
VEGEAFARARRFLNYNPLAKWSALAAGVGTGLLYVGLLFVLGLVADLMVSRGDIPTFAELPPATQSQVLRSWESWPAVERKQHLVDIGVPERTAEQLEKADLNKVSPGDRELIWRSQVYLVLHDQVGPDAANLITAQESEHALANRGVLPLVVRSKDRLYAPVLGWMARANPWMWRWGDPANSSFYRQPNFFYLLGLFLLAVALALVRSLLSFLMVFMAGRAVTEAATRLRRAVYHQTFRLGTLAVRALGPSEAVGIFTRELEAVRNSLFAWLTVVYREPVKFVLVLAFGLLVNFWLGLAFLFFALLVWLIGGQVAAYYRRQGRLAMQRAAEELAHVQESLMLMRLVKVYLMELFNQARVERQLARYSRAEQSRYHGEAIAQPLLFFLGTLAASLLVTAAGVLVLTRQLGIGNAITLVTALVSLYWPVMALLGLPRILRRGRASAVALFEFLDRRGDVGQVVGAEFLPPLSKQIEFDEVSLREPGTDHMLLEGVNLTIQAGQRVALVGADESAKHALVYLLPRFLDPNSGEIRFDDHNLRWVTLESLRAQMALVMQHNLVFNDTVANNIGCGDTGYTLPQIIEAAKVAHAHQFIQKLPNGYETLIGEMGHPLGQGEQFLIALARAILRDPAVLIIEEPMTALDDNIKALLDDTFARVLPGRTVIFLPHRTTTIRSCDRIFLLHNGHIEATGDHRELLSQNELYRHLHYIEFTQVAEQV